MICQQFLHELFAYVFFLVIKGYIGATEQVRDEESSKDGKIVLDLIEAIHAAEKKQAESDAFVFAEERRVLKVCFIA